MGYGYALREFQVTSTPWSARSTSLTGPPSGPSLRQNMVLVSLQIRTRRRVNPIIEPLSHERPFNKKQSIRGKKQGNRMKTTTHIRAPSRVPQSRDGLTVRSVLKSGLLAFALVFGLRVSGQTTTTATNFSVNMAVPDALPSGLASSKIVATPITYISS